MRILLVDDGVDNLRLFSMILKKAGADVTLARNGLEGVHTVEKGYQEGKSFDIILMDMQMPVMDGLTATKNLRDQGVKIPIVALTGNTMEEELEQCFVAGFTDFITKPILGDTLLSSIVKIINSY